MRILFIQDSLGTGGAERSNAELWYYLREKGIEIKIAVLEHRKEGIESEILAAGFEVIFLDPASFWGHVNQVKKLIKDFRPDIVHSVLFKAALRTRFAKLIIKFFHIESLVNSTYAEIRYNDPKIKKWVLKSYEYLDKFSQGWGVDHFVAITKEVAKHYREHLNIANNRISVIYRGRKDNKNIHRKNLIKAHLLDELNLDGKGLIFIHVGRQEFQKAHIDILKAIKIADEHLSRTGAKFLFCGRKGNASHDIEQFLRNNNLKTTLKFLGHRNDIYELLVASDVFVFPSLFEGLGGSLIEAQAAGLPIICSDIDVFKEVVVEENSLIHEAHNPDSLAEQLNNILEANLEKMGNASLNNYKDKFQLESVNQQMLDLYKLLV